MPYYHVYIDMDGDETEETDLSLEQLTKHIVRPYNQHSKFMCKGRIVYPSDITTIRIIETEQPSSELLPKIKAEKGMFRLLGLYSSDVLLIAEKERDVTREFLRIRVERKGKTLRKKAEIQLSKNVFIVHGRDHNPMEELKIILKEFGLNPIVLHEQPSGSRTIVEKLEKYSGVGYAFVILTPDDAGSQMSSLLEIPEKVKPWIYKPALYTGRELNEMFEIFKPRARQNVVLEFGYFIGKLGRDRVCCLHKGDVERPSDMEGIVYIPFKDSVNEARAMIIKELKEAGYEIKL